MRNVGAQDREKYFFPFLFLLRNPKLSKRYFTQRKGVNTLACAGQITR